MNRNKLVLATHNQGKVQEIGKFFEEAGFEVLGLHAFPHLEQEIEETGTTFEANALLKARYYTEKTGCITLADDSGLEVEVLKNAPGVYSARYAQIRGDNALLSQEISKDEKNILQLLSDLQDYPHPKARFCCCLAMVFPSENKELVSHGYWEGEIQANPQGKNGFGYDPIFYDPVMGKTAAQLTSDEKNACSHRAEAIKKMLEMLKKKI